MLMFMAPIVANFALDFGPPEYFSVYMLTFCSFVGMGRQSPFKVISIMMFGFAFSCVGTITALSMIMLFWPLISKLLGVFFHRQGKPATA